MIIPSHVWQRGRELVFTKKVEVSGCIPTDDKGVCISIHVKSHGTHDTTPMPPASCHVTFHTHPEVAYKKYKSALGWPSGDDLAVIAMMKLPFHLVFAIEGIYLVECSGACKQYTQKKSESLRKQFTEYHEKRTFKYISKHGIIEPSEFAAIATEHGMTMYFRAYPSSSTAPVVF